VVVPNRKIVGEILHNYGRIRQADVRVGVGYEVDLPQTLVLIKDIVFANTRVLRDPAPVIGVAALGDSAVQIAVQPWVSVEDYGSVGGELSVAIVEACRRRGISIPFPQREVRLIGRG
jgi:small conductance mechanosensitive channel